MQFVGLILFQHLVKRTERLLGSIDSFDRDLKITQIEVKTLSNNFEAIADNQFVENRVCEDDESTLSSLKVNIYEMQVYIHWIKALEIRLLFTQDLITPEGRPQERIYFIAMLCEAFSVVLPVLEHVLTTLHFQKNNEDIPEKLCYKDKLEAAVKACTMILESKFETVNISISDSDEDNDVGSNR